MCSSMHFSLDGAARMYRRTMGPNFKPLTNSLEPLLEGCVGFFFSSLYYPKIRILSFEFFCESCWSDWRTMGKNFKPLTVMESFNFCLFQWCFFLIIFEAIFGTNSYMYCHRPMKLMDLADFWDTLSSVCYHF